MRGRSLRRKALIVSIIWAVLVLVGLQGTLDSLRHDDFDGLNNMLQLPFSMSWAWLRFGSTDHVANAWFDAGSGLFNAVLIYAVASHASRDRAAG